jgi:hypothetical protein
MQHIKTKQRDLTGAKWVTWVTANATDETHKVLSVEQIDLGTFIATC